MDSHGQPDLSGGSLDGMNATRRAWASGGSSVGTWQGAVTQLEAERLGGIGYDWVLYDMESSGVHWSDLIPLFQATELGGTRAMVRVPYNDPALIMRALNYGAIGVVVPMVSTADEASSVGRATRYPPTGYRGSGQLRRGYSSRTRANDDIVCVVMIETAEGWENLDAIAATPGIDVVMIGQVDLAMSLGWLDEAAGGVNIATDRRLLEALQRVVDVTAEHGKHAGAATVGASDDEIETLLGLGVRWLGYRPRDHASELEERQSVDRWKRVRADRTASCGC